VARVLRRSDLPPGSRACVEALGTTVALFNIYGRLYAVDNACPHQGGPLCYGRIGGALLPSDPYEHVLGLENRVLTCPWHGWEFNLETGATLFEPHVSLARYDVWVDGEEILVSST
jgi:nitrite reductase/ring-hydroxylating ferredoxin subunit